MPAKAQTRQQILEQMLDETYQVVAGQYIQVAQTFPLSHQNSKGLLLKLKPTPQANLKNQVAQEEFQAIMQKLTELIQKPPTNYQDENLLYLEQQVSDILGFSVSASRDGYQIPYIGGVMAGLPHLKRTPTDELKSHQFILEAGLRKKRSFYGWFSPNTLNQKQIEYERFYFSLPINLTPAWKADPKKTAEYFKYRKLVMVNPARNVAVVGVLADIGPYNLTRAQFGGSPEVVRLGEVWHPESKGKVAIFFVDDPKNQVPLGKTSLNYV